MISLLFWGFQTTCTLEIVCNLLQKSFNNEFIVKLLLLLLSRFTRVQLCATP